MEITFYRKLANKLADRVVATEEFSEDQGKRIRYGLVCIFSDLYKFLLLLLIFSIFSQTINFLIAFTAFLLLRPFLGGYHSKSELLCILVSFLTILISVMLGRMGIIPDFAHLILIILLPITGILISPVRTKKVDEKTLQYKILAFILTTAALTIDYYLLPGQILLISIIEIYLLALFQLSKNKIFFKKS